jgi:hypothetical protein
VLRVKDARHYWHARHGRRLHLVATSNAHRGNLAVLATVAEDESGAMTIGLQNTPADRREAFISLPGGNTRFDLFHDEATRLFWLVSNQIRDSLCRVERLPQGRPGLPCDDLQRLQIHFSRNLVDWCFAGFLDGVTETGEGRHSPSVTARGNDLYVVCCAGRVQHRPPFATPRVTLCTVPEFRELAY